MNKNQLYQEIAVVSHTPISTVHIVGDALIETIVSQIIKGNAVKIRGFGTFDKRFEVARRGFNPFTKEELNLPEGYKMCFKAAKTLKERINIQKP